MRRIIVIVMVAVVAFIVFFFCHQEQVPTTAAPQASERETSSATAPQTAVVMERPQEDLQRELASSAGLSNEVEEVLLSPLEALANYSLDLHKTAREGDVTTLLRATGVHLNHPALREQVTKRWGFSKHHTFPEAEPLGNALYAYWIERAKPEGLGLRDALLTLVWSEEEFEIWKHWVSLLANHNDAADHAHIIHEVRRLMESYDRARPDCAARIAVLLSWLTVHDSFGAAQQQTLFALLADPTIGVQVGDRFGFNLCHLVNRLPYAAMADRIPALLQHPSKEVQWGTVELLRQYVDRQQLNGEAMVGLIPDGLIRQLDGARCSAALELLASFGGQNGRERILGVARDPTSPRRDAALGFLAASGRIGLPEILEFAGDVRMALPVVGALNSLGVKGNDQAFTELRTFLAHEHADVRREAAQLLLRAGRLSAEEAARHFVAGQ